MRQIILASVSPRRKELLTSMGLVFDVMASDFNEWLDDSLSPEEMAITLAKGKAGVIADKYQEAIVIGGDTIVEIGGRQLGKAADDDEARQMLSLLAGKTHSVISGLAVICRSEDYEAYGSDTARVTFRPYSTEAVEAYIATKDYLDKAGAYGIQSGAAPLVEKVKGEVTTIIGLPVLLLAARLKDFSIEAKPVNYPLDPQIVLK